MLGGHLFTRDYLLEGVKRAPQWRASAFTLKEASAALGIGKTTLYAAIADGRLAAVKLGNRTLIPADTLDAWLVSLPAARVRPEALPSKKE